MEISKWLIEPTDKAHVPEPLRKSLLEFMTQIDFTNARAKIDGNTNMQLGDVMNALHRELDSIIQETDSEEYEGFQIDLDVDVANRLRGIIEANKGMKNLSELKERDLTELRDIMKSIKQSVQHIDRLYSETKFKKISEAAESSIRTMENEKDLEEENLPRNYLNVSMLDARSYLHQLGEGGKEIYRAIRRGLDKIIWDVKEAQEFLNKAMKGFTEEEVLAMTQEEHSFKIGNEDVKMTKAQIMSLAMLMNRKQSKNHVLKGGVRIEDGKVLKTGGKKIFGFKKTIRQGKIIHLNEMQCSKIIGTLSEKELELAKKMQGFMAGRCAAWGNETSMLMYAYKKFKDKYYFPIQTDPTQTITNDKSEDNASLHAIRNQGMTKKLVRNANNSIIVKDIFDVFSEHVTKMANYHGLAAPLSDAMRWFNFTTQEKTGDIITRDGVKAQIQRTKGKASVNYLVKLIKDINGQMNSGLEMQFVNGLMGKYKAAAVGGNIRVVLQQPTAIARAWMVMDGKYLKHAVELGKIKASISEAKKYSAIANWKSWGYYETMVGKSMKEVITGQQEFMDRVREKTMALAGAADEVTWGALWNACKYEINDTRKELKQGSKEYFEAVAERFDDIIDQTQVVDTVLHRTQFMRNKDLLAKTQTAFMAEPSKTYNMLRNAIVTKDKKVITKAFAVYGATAVLTAAAASLADALRDDDEYESYADRYGKAFLQNTMDNVNPLNMFPIIKEIPSIFSGFTSSRMDTQVFTTIYKTINTLGSDEKNWWDKLESTANVLSQLTGVPVRNIMRDYESIHNQLTHKNLGSPSTKPAKRVEMLYESIINGNEKDRAMLIDDLKDMGKTDDQIQRSMSEILNAKLKENLVTGDVENVQEGINNVVKVKKELGKEEKDIASSIKSTLTGYYKEKYLEGNNKQEIKKILLAIRVNGKALYKASDFKDWEKKKSEK